MNDTVPLWAAILLPLVGYIAAIATELIRGRQNLERDREARMEARQAEREDARDAFERDTLIQLQDTMGLLMRNFSRSYHHDELEYKRSSKWGRQQLPDEIGGETSASLARDFQRFRVRILNDVLRDRANRWSELGALATVGASKNESDADAYQRASKAWAECGDVYIEVAELIGQRLRSLVTKDGISLIPTA